MTPKSDTLSPKPETREVQDAQGGCLQQACSAAACFSRLSEVVAMTEYHPRKTHGVALLVMGADVETVAAELEYIAWALRDGKTDWQGRAQGRLITRIAYGQQNAKHIERHE